jgi:hypothetical protein
MVGEIWVKLPVETEKPTILQTCILSRTERDQGAQHNKLSEYIC